MLKSIKALHLLTVALTLLAAVVLSSGCGSIPETHYYTIGRIVPPSQSVAQKLDITVGVPKFEAEGIYERDNLLYRKGSHEIAVDYYRRWGVPPQAMLAEATIDYLRSTGLFAAVLRLPSMTDHDAVLAGRIVRFEESGGQVQVVLEYTLKSTHGNEILWQDEVESSAPVAVATSPEARITATETCIANCLRSLASSLSSADIALH